MRHIKTILRLHYLGGMEGITFSSDVALLRFFPRPLRIFSLAHWSLSSA